MGLFYLPWFKTCIFLHIKCNKTHSLLFVISSGKGDLEMQEKDEVEDKTGVELWSEVRLNKFTGDYLKRS